VTRRQRERGRIGRAQAMVAMGMQPQDKAQRRDVIPDDIKQLVWLRDGGRCRHCGAQTELQYDHISPVVMGGSSNQENLQVLCGPCSRRKSAGLTIR
jgi:5-methylcytosine-specific restriction endonuclease McrA